MKSRFHGGRAKCLQRLIRLGMPVPTTVALCFDTVKGIADGRAPDHARILAPFDKDALLSVRPSSEHADWGGPAAILNIGMNDARHAALSKTLGEAEATALYLRFIHAYAQNVARLDADAFPTLEKRGADALAQALETYEIEAEEPFPQDIEAQLASVLRAMARAWEGTSARLLRQAQGAPADAGLGLVVQAMALGVGRGESGSGVIQFIEADTGRKQITGRYARKSDALEEKAQRETLYLTKDPRGPSLEDCAPDAFEALKRHGDVARTRLREEMQIKFTLEGGALSILDAVRVPRASRAHVSVAVALAEDGIISREEAVMRIEPKALSELLHSQVAPNA
ncbi:MAG: pyruvate, phosphate dikinase, partial [Pseudomonadota bacterium]